MGHLTPFATNQAARHELGFTITTHVLDNMGGEYPPPFEKVRVMWRNRITQFVAPDRGRLMQPTRAAAATCCAPAALAVSAGAFLVPPTAGPQPGLYALAREQAVFTLRQRRRVNFVGLN